ncbi:MAG: glycosyltransferase family 4 protein [Chloroflexota bacterium]
MRVGLNAHLLSFGTSYRGAGISRYIRNLLPALRALPENAYTVYLGDRRIPPEFAPDPRFRLRFSLLPTRRPALRILWEQLWAPLAVARDGVRVLHSLGYVQPLLAPYKNVVTFHDLSYYLYPRSFNAANRLYLQTFSRWSARRATRLIAVSENTKRDLVRLLAVPADKVDVVPHGIEPEFRQLPAAEVAEFRRRRGLPERFLLFLGTIEPRKNLNTLLDAYALLKRDGLPQQLVVAGARGWQWQGVFGRVEQLGLTDDVIFPGFLPDSEQPLWYNAADLFVYPSLYEGFGFPPLEAMACGTPVVASDTSALPEVVADAGLLFDPRSAESLALCVRRALWEPELGEELSRRGLARARLYSWQEAARRTAAVYAKADNGDSNDRARV